jgi:putative transposase
MDHISTSKLAFVNNQEVGCPWRYLPKDVPSCHVVNYYYNKWTDNRMLEQVNTALRQRLREKRPDAKPDGGHH